MNRNTFVSVFLCECDHELKIGSVSVFVLNLKDKNHSMEKLIYTNKQSGQNKEEIDQSSILKLMRKYKNKILFFLKENVD